MCDGLSKGVSNFEGRFEASRGVSSASKLYRGVLEVVELLT